MSRKRTFAGTLGLAAMTMVAEPSAFALPPTPLTASSSQPTPATRQTARASLRLDISRAKAWVGQGLPVTLQAFFRGAEGVTLEGTPQLTSSGIFTSELSREPRQSTEIIGGEPVLVATWTGTLTPSSAATLLIVAELPVQIRYREAAPSRVEQADPFGDDPFGALTSNPFDTSAIQRFFQQSMQQSMGSIGRIRQEAVSLRTSARPIEVQDLPTANRPSSFTGAIGRFNLSAAVSSTHVHESEPVTLQVVVDGDGDLDRVDLGGVSTSNIWKAYPPKATIEAPSKGKRGRKVFEQVLVPLRGGDLNLPAVAMTSFDPDSSRYVTSATQPLVVTVDGTAVAADETAQIALAVGSPPLSETAPPADAGPLVAHHTVTPGLIALWLSPLVPLLAVLAFVARTRRKGAERALRRTMRKAAFQGDVVPFYRSAHALIDTRLSERWGVRPEDVGVPYIRERLGAVGDPLAEALAVDEALRFGRGYIENPDLVSLCSSIERSLGSAS